MIDGDKLTRRQLLALTGAGAATGLAGCASSGGGEGDGGDGGNGDGGNGDGGGGQGTEDPTQLPPIHMLTDFNNEAWQKKWDDELIPKFEKETGIDVEMEYAGFSGGGQEERLATLLQSGDPPALSEGTMEQVADIWAAGELKSTTAAIDEITRVAGDTTSNLFQDGNSDNFMFPHGYYSSNFIYREDVYEELGLDVPESFQALLDNAKAIDESDLDIRGFGLSAEKAGKAQDEFQVFLANMGAGELHIKDGTMSDDVPEAELWFPQKEMVTLLKYQKKLAQYSPDPTAIGWGTSLKQFASGRFAQQYNLNMWPGGVAAAVDDTVAKNTGIAPLPRWKEGGIDRKKSRLSNPTPDGHFPYRNAENTPGTFEWMKWLYGDTMKRTGRMYETEPTRFVPIYQDVISSDTYQNYDHWQQYPSHLEGLQYVQDTIVKEYYNNVKEAQLLGYKVPEARYVARFFFLGEMVNQVIAADRDPVKAYEDAKQQAKKRLKEGKDKLR